MWQIRILSHVRSVTMSSFHEYHTQNWWSLAQYAYTLHNLLYLHTRSLHVVKHNRQTNQNNEMESYRSASRAELIRVTEK